jgi:DNA polymerase III alpha subunit
MAFIQVEDLDGSIETVVFPKTYTQFKDMILFDTPLAFRGRVSVKKSDDDGDKSEPEKTEEEKNKYGGKSIILEEIRRI